MEKSSSKVITRYTAKSLMSRGQLCFYIAAAIVFIGILIVNPRIAGLLFITASLLFYTCFVGFKLLLWCAASRGSKPTPVSAVLNRTELPEYTVFIPLYHEANMLPSLVKSIGQLNYPKEKLQVLLLLEEDDNETRVMAETMDLPYYFSQIIVPDCKPKTKPKALNMGLEQALGEFCVIYDAEDRPDPDQLLKAAAAFRSQATSENVACVQARLSFWNDQTNWLTRFYWIDYAVHFNWVLHGLAKLGLIPPLGGTSNHFRTEILRKIAIAPDELPPEAKGIGGWDPYNVTEDAELAGALAMRGYRIQMIDSVTNEEATTRLGVADRQRRRWMKGYLQTGLVYTRHPLRTARAMGPLRWFCYILLMLGTPTCLLLNPVFWGMTITYFTTKSEIIASLFPMPLYSIGIALTLLGNLLLFYQQVIACLKRGSYGSVKYMLLVPLWWLFISYISYRMLIELINPKTRYIWNKTEHGQDLSKEAVLSRERSI